MTIITAGSSTGAAREHYTTGSVTSRDGATIGYRQLGEALSDSFTVYLPDRRGRGMSGPYSKDYGIQQDVEDMDALLTKTGAHHVFGVSSGGIICLQAALTLPAIHKAAIFEPPFFMND